MIKANIGEWSELYSLAYLLVHGGAFAADINQAPDKSTFHKVLQVHFPIKNGRELNYVVTHDSIAINDSGLKIAEVRRSEIELFLKKMFTDLTDGTNSGTFELPSGEALAKLLSRDTISAGSGELINDLELILEDPDTGSPTPRVGFNIKSQVGGRATLLNASGSTNIIYKVQSTSPGRNVEFPIFEHGKHRSNIQNLYRNGYQLCYHEMSSETFANNLVLLDMNFPEYLAKVLLNSYLLGIDQFSNAVDTVFPIEKQSSRQPIFKLKEFLGAVAMGLRPSKAWDGDTTKFRGIIIVKSDGECVFYYLKNRKNFEEYLFSSVSFERPSTTRHKYGSIYESNGENYIKLNLQIRFSS
jgi:hypothetical protein